MVSLARRRRQEEVKSVTTNTLGQTVQAVPGAADRRNLHPSLVSGDAYYIGCHLQRRTRERQADDWRWEQWQWEPEDRFLQVSLKLASDSRGVETRAEGAPTGGQQHAEHWLPSGPAGRSKLSSTAGSALIARTQ